MIIFFLEYSMDIQKVILKLKKNSIKNVIHRGKIGGSEAGQPRMSIIGGGSSLAA